MELEEFVLENKDKPGLRKLLDEQFERYDPAEAAAILMTNGYTQQAADLVIQYKNWDIVINNARKIARERTEKPEAKEEPKIKVLTDYEKNGCKGEQTLGDARFIAWRDYGKTPCG
jgi:hypothetical protein